MLTRHIFLNVVFMNYKTITNYKAIAQKAMCDMCVGFVRIKLRIQDVLDFLIGISI